LTAVDDLIYRSSMKATTVKVEGELLQELERRKPPALSLSAFVKSILRSDLLRRQLTEASVRYAEFLAANPTERAWLAEWDGADLASRPSRRRRR
jgi:hypothetical protein